MDDEFDEDFDVDYDDDLDDLDDLDDGPYEEEGDDLDEDHFDGDDLDGLEGLYEDGDDSDEEYDQERERRSLKWPLIGTAVIAAAVAAFFLFSGGDGEQAPVAEPTISTSTTEPTVSEEPFTTTPEETTETTTSETPLPSEKIGAPVTNPEISAENPLGAVAGFLDGFYQQRKAEVALKFFRPGGATESGTQTEINQLIPGKATFVVTPLGNNRYDVLVTIGKTEVRQIMDADSADGKWYVDKITAK